MTLGKEFRKRTRKRREPSADDALTGPPGRGASSVVISDTEPDRIRGQLRASR